MPVLQGAEPGFALVRGSDHWVRASFEDCSLVDEAVQLAWDDRIDPDDPQPAPAPPRGAGLAFDGQCRLYRSLPDAGGIERLRWAAQDPLSPHRPGPAPLPLFAAPPGPLGDFAPVEPPPPVECPRGLAVDADDRLFIALHGARRVLVLDLWSGDILRRIALPGRPLDLAADLSSGRREVVAITESPAGLYRLSARGAPRVETLPVDVAMPARIAVAPDGGRWLLSGAATESARLLELAAPRREYAVPCATDLTFYTPAKAGDAEGPILVVARQPGQTFRCLRPGPSGLEKLPGLAARGYDGLGIAATPDRRIAFWTAAGLRYAVARRGRYRPGGRVVGFRLDSGAFQTAWGRLFLDACIPRDTEVRVHCVAADDPPQGESIPRLAPVNLPDPQILHDDLSPPLPVPSQIPARGSARGLLHRRAEGSELPWLRRARDDAFATYETPIATTRGRYLWVILELKGNGTATPRVRALRAERPAHDLVERLPRVLSREDAAARFLDRFLAPFAGLLADLDARARLRHALIDPASSPGEALPWLAGLFGLVLDERWPEAVRRQVIDEAMELFRFRGTVAGLSRFLAIVTGVAPILVEHWRMRGGAVIGEPVARGSRAVLGGGMRIGGQVGTTSETRLSGESAADAFATHAHRFTVMLPALLSEATLDLAAWVLELHRPAHTLYQLCTVTAGSRVGRGLHVGLSSVIGRGSGWAPVRVGAAALGRSGIVGRPRPGTNTDGARLGRDTRVG